jgi:hypothetical protein
MGCPKNHSPCWRITESTNPCKQNYDQAVLDASVSAARTRRLAVSTATKTVDQGLGDFSTMASAQQRSSRATTNRYDPYLHFCAMHAPPTHLMTALRKGEPLGALEWNGPFPGPYTAVPGQSELFMARWELKKALRAKETGQKGKGLW